MTIYALALAVVAAWMLALRVPTRRQRELAAGLSALLAINVARIWELPPRVDHALSAAWYAVTAALVWRALAPERFEWVRLVIGFSVMAYAPDSIVATFWISLAIQLLAAGHAVTRREIPDQVATSALILAASSLADVAGPWLLGRYQQEWAIGRIPAIVTWLSIAGWELRCWISARRPRG